MGNTRPTGRSPGAARIYSGEEAVAMQITDLQEIPPPSVVKGLLKSIESHGRDRTRFYSVEGVIEARLMDGQWRCFVAAEWKQVAGAAPGVIEYKMYAPAGTVD
jgi:hypothetical protein